MTSGQSASMHELKQLVNAKTLEIKIEKLDPKEAGESMYCKVCCKKIESNIVLKQHMLLHAKEKPFACSECDRGYDRKGCLERHLAMKHNEKRFNCERCQVSFKIEANWKVHMLTHTAQKKPFACTVCKYKSGSIARLKKHLIVHADAKSKKCLHCEKKFNNNRLVLNHLMTHTNFKPFPCSECGKKFRWEGDCDKHLLTHKLDNVGSSDKKFHKIKQAMRGENVDASLVEFYIDEGHQNLKDERTNKNSNVNITKTTLHIDSSKCINNMFSCSICKYSFANVSVLKRHMLEHATKNYKACIHCNKTFKREISLCNHLMTHANNITKKRSLKQEHLDLQSHPDVHFSIHTGVMPVFQCTLCVFKAITQQDLDVHLSSHTGEMPVSCYICNYKSAFQRNLDQHYRMTHMNEKSSISVPLKDLKI